MFGKVRPEVDGPVRERAVLVNKNTDKLSTVDSRHVDKSTFCDMLTVNIPTVYFYTPPLSKIYLITAAFLSCACHLLQYAPPYPHVSIMEDVLFSSTETDEEIILLQIFDIFFLSFFTTQTSKT